MFLQSVSYTYPHGSPAYRVYRRKKRRNGYSTIAVRPDIVRFGINSGDKEFSIFRCYAAPTHASIERLRRFIAAHDWPGKASALRIRRERRGQPYKLDRTRF